MSYSLLAALLQSCWPSWEVHVDANTQAVNDCDEVEQSTDMLVARFNKHVSAVNTRMAYVASSHYCIEVRASLYERRLTWHMCAARGLHKLLAERAVKNDDNIAGNAALGAPHWLTYSDTQIAQRAK